MSDLDYADLITVFSVEGNTYVTSNVNGQTIKLFRSLDACAIQQLKEKGFFNKKSKKMESPKTITMSLNISNKCNLKCKYCFNQCKDGRQLTFEQCRVFMDNVIEMHKTANRFIVDISGSGEPLLSLDLVLLIAEYCRKKSNEINREVLVMFASNGILLSNDISELLKKNNILYGISLDGLKKDNKYRIDFNNKNCFKKVMSNVKQIKNLDYVGVAVTLHSETQNLVRIVKKLSIYFSTISIKPVRNNFNYGLNENNIEGVISNYYNLCNFLLRQTIYKKNLKYIKALLNGDDYFGRYIYRIIMNQTVSSRCDIGFSRYSLGIDGEVYGCPALVGIKKVSLERKLDVLRSKECDNCYIRHICGGECMANSYKFSKEFYLNDKVMCTYKKNLFNLSIHLVDKLKHHPVFDEIKEFCIKRHRREFLNPKIYEIMKKESVPFLDAKMIIDSQKDI